jgi:glycosyltransferase 2 family protein
LFMFGGILVSLLFLYFTFRDTDFGALHKALGSSNYWALAPALLVLAVAIVLRSIRWRFLISPAHRPSLRAVTSALLVGYLFNSILPARAGEAIRVLVLRQRAGTPKFEALGTVVAERALDVLALLLLLFVTVPVVPATTWMAKALVVGAVLFIGIAAAFVALALYGERPARLMLRPLTMLPRMSRHRIDVAASNLIGGLSAFRRPAVALPAFALTLASWLLIALAAWICMWGFDLRLGFAAGVLVVVAINLAMILPSGPAGVVSALVRARPARPQRHTVHHRGLLRSPTPRARPAACEERPGQGVGGRRADRVIELIIARQRRVEDVRHFSGSARFT